jgi:hypothetical protein
MPNRHLPVRPDLEQLKHQAKDLLRRLRSGDPGAIEDFQKHHSKPLKPADARLADAQLVLARSYLVRSWPRLVIACRLIDAIWRDDVDTVRDLVRKHPELLHEQALARQSSSWGPPMSYAANLGRDRMIQMLHQLGARDHLYALGRATLQGHVDTARMLYAMAGRPRIPDEELGSPAYTLSASGTAVLFELGLKSTMRTAAPLRRWLWFWRPTAATRRPNTRYWKCTSSTDSNCRTLRLWPFIGDASTCWKSTCAAIPTC